MPEQCDQLSLPSRWGKTDALMHVPIPTGRRQKTQDHVIMVPQLTPDLGISDIDAVLFFISLQATRQYRATYAAHMDIFVSRNHLHKKVLLTIPVAT